MFFAGTGGVAIVLGGVRWGGVRGGTCAPFQGLPPVKTSALLHVRIMSQGVPSTKASPIHWQANMSGR